MSAASDARFMALALSLGQRGQGCVWPNPAVGCVIVKGTRIIGRGWTQPGGRPHAEAMALEQAGALAQQATAFVTLEPCAHHGATPPCAEALIAAGIARCVVAIADPDPRVSGKGITKLQEAGIEVSAGCRAKEALVAHRGFFSRLQNGRPRVTLKLATSLDGRIATVSGESQWITGADARRDVHGLRACHDAVLVGGGTARADNPSLNVRGLGLVRQPIRIVASRHLDFDASDLQASRDVAPLWLCHGPQARVSGVWQSQCDALLQVPLAPEGQLDLVVLMQALAKKGLTSVLCEGGGQLAASLLRAGLVDDVILYTAGLALGADGLAGLGDLALSHLHMAPRFALISARKIGPDIRQDWRRLP